MCLKRCCIVRATIEFVAMLHRRCLLERMQWITEGISDQHCHQAANARDSWSMSTNIRQTIRELRVEPAQCRPTSVFGPPLADQTSSWAPTTAYIWMGIEQRQPAMPISMALEMDQAPNRQPQKTQPQQPPLNYKWLLLIAIAAIHSAWYCPKVDRNFQLPFYTLDSDVYSSFRITQCSNCCGIFVVSFLIFFFRFNLQKQNI